MAATDLERLVVQLSADIRKYENSLGRAMGLTNKQAKAIETRFAKMNRNISSSFQSALSSSIATIGGALGVAEITKYADAWTVAGNKVKAAADIAGVQTRSLDQLKDGANEARTDLESYVDLYAKLIRSASNVAKSEEEVARATTVVSKAFKAGGASTQEQIAGIMQLSQALGSGVLQGDELRSLRENAPILAQAIANEFKTTIAGLKELGAEGKITSDRVFKAILDAQRPIESAFNKTQATIRDAMTQVNNEFTAYIGNADSSAGASAKLVQALQFLAENFKQVGDVVIQFATVIIGALTGRALVGVVAGLGNAIVALGAFITAVRTGTLVAASFTAALGPIGLIAGGAAAAIYLINDSMNATESAVASANSAIASNAQALDAAKGSSEGYTAALRNQIKMQYEAAKASFELAYAELNAARARAENFRSMTKALTGYELSFDPFDHAAKQADDNATAIGKAALELRAQLEKIDAEMANQPSGFGNSIDVSAYGGAGKDRINEYKREIKQIKERTASLRAETAAQAKINPLINDYGYAVEFAAAKQDLLTAAQEAGVKITPEIAASIHDLASGYASAVAASEQLAEKQDEIRQRAEEAMATARDVTRGIIDGFVEGASAADVLAESLKKIGSALLDDVLNSIFQINDASGGGGLLSIFGGLFGGRGTGSGVNYFPPAPKFATGTRFAPGGTAVVGERGPELVNLPRGSQVVPTIPSMKALKAGIPSTSVTYAPQIDARGADAAAVARLEQVMARDRAEFESKTVAAIRNARSRGVKGV
ncbi:tape measure protein [Sinorhizobium meliloti]|nr:tape measure protein [Sinorhizobium meliloti]